MYTLCTKCVTMYKTCKREKARLFASFGGDRMRAPLCAMAKPAHPSCLRLGREQRGEHGDRGLCLRRARRCGC